jgi:hypothetical protein
VTIPAFDEPQQTVIKFVSDRECREKSNIKRLKGNVFCGSSQDDSVDECLGDTGGPVVVSDYFKQCRSQEANWGGGAQPRGTITRKNTLQIHNQVVARFLSNPYQDVFALFVTSCYHLVTRLMTVTDLLHVVPTRLLQAVRNKLLQACCHLLVNNLLRADDIRLVGTTCSESVDLINLVTR